MFVSAARPLLGDFLPPRPNRNVHLGRRVSKAGYVENGFFVKIDIAGRSKCAWGAAEFTKMGSVATGSL